MKGANFSGMGLGILLKMLQLQSIKEVEKGNKAKRLGKSDHSSLQNEG
jgi:hypothetical protein